MFLHASSGLLYTVMLAAFLEWVAHNFLMHSRWLGNLTGNSYLKRQFIDHAVLHHHRYYKVFNDEPDPFGKTHNLDISVLSGILLCAPFGIVMLWFDPLIACMFFAGGVLQPLIWSAFHREMHIPKGVWWSRNFVFRYVRYHHILHHFHPQKNLGGLLPFFDWIFFTSATPTARDRAKLRELYGTDSWWRVSQTAPRPLSF